MSFPTCAHVWLVFILAQLFPLIVGKMLVFRGDKHIISSNTNTGWQHPRYKKELFICVYGSVFELRQEENTRVVPSREVFALREKCNYTSIFKIKHNSVTGQ